MQHLAYVEAHLRVLHLATDPSDPESHIVGFSHDESMLFYKVNGH